MNFAEDELCPGWPGRGYDPTASFTNTQWYLYHQRNVAFFAAFASIEYDRPRAIALARGLISLLPHLADGYRGGPTEGILGRLVSVEDVTTLDGFPERWMTDGREVFADANLPLFRIRIARRTGGTDAEGRRAFVLVWVSHALAEGTDSAMLCRSRDATPVTAGWKPLRPGRRDILAKAVGAMGAVAQLVVARVVTTHRGRKVVVSRVLRRDWVAVKARQLGTTQRALLMGLGALVICGGGLDGARRRFSATYSFVDAGGRTRSDPFMRMRMRFAVVENEVGFDAFVRRLDARLKRSERSAGAFNDKMNDAAIAVHRQLAGIAPFLYSPEVFDFMPYDLVFGLLPPHWLTGGLTAGLLEPVYAGAVVPGVSGCVAVPGRHHVTLNFQIEERLLPNLRRLDAIVP